LTTLDDLNTLEQQKILELFDSVALLLKSDLVQLIDGNTYDQLLQMRELVQGWVKGESELTHDELFSAIENLTGKLAAGKSVLLGSDHRYLH
jgi:hypothetical protein